MPIEPIANLFATFCKPRIQLATLDESYSGAKDPQWHRKIDVAQIASESHITRHIPSPPVDPPGIEPGSPVCRTDVVPLDYEPMQSGEWGSNPRSPAPKAAGLPLSYPLFTEWTARDLHPHFRRAEPASSCWTSSPVLFKGPPGT